MEKGAKIALAITGVVVAIGAGFGIYYATRTKTTSGGNTGGGSSGSGGASGNGLNINIDQIKDVLGQIAAATKEKFPFRVGMYGPNIKAMQTALREKFGQTAVKSDGIFGPKTLTALKNTKYMNNITDTINDEQFLAIIDGVKKNQALGFGPSADGVEAGNSHDFWKAGFVSGNYTVI